MSDERDSLRDLAAVGLGLVNPKFTAFLRRQAVNDADAFADVIEDDLEDIIRRMEAGANHRKTDGEDRLTSEIVNCLCQTGYDATQDENQGGHSDVTVKLGRFTWLGEAKIHNGYDYLWEGFLQLTTRYSTGSVDCCRGGMLIYIRNRDGRSVMESWKEALEVKTFEDGTGVSVDLDSKNPLRLWSLNKHKRSGLDYRVRHFGVLLYTAPEDKSARQSAQNGRKAG